MAGQVWFDTITGEISADCDFATFAGLTVAAAGARYGETSREVEAVRTAWVGVGVLTADAPGNGSGTPGAPADPAAPTDPGTPADPGTPPPGTEVAVRRTGGFAGRTRERTVAIEDLPDADTLLWQRLLATDRLTGLAAAVEREYPDAYCYGVRCARPALDVTVPEPALTDDVRALLERTLRGEDTA